MKTFKMKFPVIALVILCASSFAFRKHDHANREPAFANTLSFGGKSVGIDMTDCSTDNSSDGKSRAISAINSAEASSCTIQFKVLTPTTGTYTTAEDSDEMKANEVVLGAAGKSFDNGALIAKAGQTISVTNNGGRYRATFKEISVVDPTTKGAVTKKISGDFGCDR